MKGDYDVSSTGYRSGPIWHVTGAWDFEKRPRLVTPSYDREVAAMAEEARSIRRGFRFGILAGLLLWPCMVAFCWLVVFLARSIR